MKRDELINAVTSILTWDDSLPDLTEKVRVVITGHTGDVAVERSAPGAFHVTTGDHGSQSIYRSRRTTDLREAAELFVHALAAERIGYNLGSTQREFESQFDPPPEEERITLKDAMQFKADRFEKLGRMYLAEAEKYRQAAVDI